MEGVVRVSSADMNDRRNRWETGNEGKGEGSGKNEHVLGPWASRKRPKTNEIPLPSLSFSLPSWALPPTGGATATLHIPPTPRWKSWTNREGAFPATYDPQLHPRSSLCNVLSSESFALFFGKQFFPRFFRCFSINLNLTNYFNWKVKFRLFFVSSFFFLCVFRRVYRIFTKIRRFNFLFNSSIPFALLIKSEETLWHVLEYEKPKSFFPNVGDRYLGKKYDGMWIFSFIFVSYY